MMRLTKIWKSVVGHLTWRVLAVLSAALLVLSLLPVIYLSFFNYATGDDLSYGAAVHRVVTTGGSILDGLLAIASNIRTSWYGFQGTWSSIALFSVEPSVFGERFYTLTTWIALICLVLCQGLLLKELLVRLMGLPAAVFFFLFGLIGIVEIQYLPYHRSGLFWYTGMAHYIIPYGVCALSFVWMIRLMTSQNLKMRYFTGILLSQIYLGGAGYPEVVLVAVIDALMLAAALLPGFSKLRRRAALLILPFISVLAGFIVSAKAPGNRIRGGADFGFSADKAVHAILLSLKAGITDGITYFLTARPLILIVGITAVCAFEALDSPASAGRLKWKYPHVVLPLLYLIFSAIHAPENYVGEDVGAGISGGVYNSYWLVFIVCVTAATVYICGWLRFGLGIKVPGNFSSRIRTPFILLCLLFCLIFNRHLIGGTTDKVAIDYITSGELLDFTEQMRVRLEILENPEIEDAVLEPMNDWQGPLMHFPVTDDPRAFTNYATALFYNKNSVVVKQ